MREGQVQVVQSSPDEVLAAKQMQKEVSDKENVCASSNGKFLQIDRLREESSKRIKEMEESLRQQFQKQSGTSSITDSQDGIQRTFQVMRMKGKRMLLLFRSPGRQRRRTQTMVDTARRSWRGYSQR